MGRAAERANLFHRGAAVLQIEDFDGRALLRELARIAIDRGCGRFEWSVLDWNEPATAFYRSIGAPPMPDWRICRLTGEALASLAR